eukprot:COSAG01_NODE_4817_length_4724_cov_3.025081_4_plen_363_part_00
MNLAGETAVRRLALHHATESPLSVFRRATPAGSSWVAGSGGSPSWLPGAAALCTRPRGRWRSSMRRGREPRRRCAWSWQRTRRRWRAIANDRRPRRWAPSLSSFIVCFAFVLRGAVGTRICLCVARGWHANHEGRPWAGRWCGYKTSMRARHRASIRRRSRFWRWWASISSPNACWAPLAVHPNVPPIASFAPLRHRSTDNRPAQLTIAPQHNHAPRHRSGARARGGAGRGRLHAGGAAAAARGGDRGGGPAAGGASPALRAPDGRRTHSIDIITRRRRRRQRRRVRSWRCPASVGPGWEAGRGGGLPGGRGRGAGGVADSVGGRAFPAAWWVAFGAPPPRLDERPARWLGNRTHGGGWLTG